MLILAPNDESGQPATMRLSRDRTETVLIAVLVLSNFVMAATVVQLARAVLAQG